MVSETQRKVPREVSISYSQKQIRDRMQSENLVVIPWDEEVYAHVKSLPELVRGDNRVHFERDAGQLWLDKYYEPRGEVDLDKSTIIYRRGIGEPSKVMALRSDKFETIEDMIRGAGYVADQYDRKTGSAVLKTKQVIGAIRWLIHELRTDEPMTEGRREELIDTTVSMLSAAGFYDARKEIKKKIAAQVTAAAHQDSLSRDNSLVARSELGSALLKTTEELLFAKLVNEKYPYLYVALNTEREFERFIMEQGVERIEQVLKLREGNKEIRRALSSLQGFMQNYIGSGRVKAAPYRGPAAFAYASIMGSRANFMNQRLEYYVGPEHVSLVPQMLQKDTLYEVYIDPQNPPALQTWEEEIAPRLGTAQTHLQLALESGESGLNKNAP